ncbi:hypothetical protein MKZ38_005033 [Zalerion maritima]|uniref:Uncharacterized protein n=1 Tax=Zalerion maritima TaxID=339359 RepID=A0AAD5WWA1_9PEZI|nr:hypothetical protein MKZ38_005033 [Zalerion maritima]
MAAQTHHFWNPKIPPIAGGAATSSADKKPWIRDSGNQQPKKIYLGLYMELALAQSREPMDLDQIERIRGQLAGLGVPKAPPLILEEFQYFWDRGNKRRPFPPNRADNTKVNLVDGVLPRHLPVFNAKGEIQNRRPKHDPPILTTTIGDLSEIRGKTTFKIGLDWLDNSLIRDFLMWTGCRRHELVYAQPKNKQKKIKEHDEESDVYTDIDEPEPYILVPRPKECWVCGGVDERTDAQYNVLRWEDINLWILHNPMRDGGRDYLAIQVLLRFHKGHNKEIMPTWFPFVEKKLPLLCPISKLLAKAISKGVVNLSGYDTCAEPYFNTKISIPAARIPWKKEFRHKPVFRKTVEFVEGPIKLNKPLKAKALNNDSEKLGKAGGFPDRFQSYNYRRGNLEILDSKSPFAIMQRAKYKKSTNATGADRKVRERKANKPRAARQRRRRKAADLLRKEHFKKRNNTELDRQLRGIHGPQQSLQKVILSLPERRLLAEILGDLDENLPEIEIVQRKVDAINAWIDYAWKIEPKEPAPSQNQRVIPRRGHSIAPKPRYVSMIQNPVSPTAPMRPGTAVGQDPPPPPYSEVDTAPPSGAVMLGGSGKDTPLAARKPTPKPHKYFFCGRRFTRKGIRGDCKERYLKRRPTDAVPCPDPGCKAKGMVLENKIQDYDNNSKDSNDEPKELRRSTRPKNTPDRYGAPLAKTPQGKKEHLKVDAGDEIAKDEDQSSCGDEALSPNHQELALFDSYSNKLLSPDDYDSARDEPIVTMSSNHNAGADQADMIAQLQEQIRQLAAQVDRQSMPRDDDRQRRGITPATSAFGGNDFQPTGLAAMEAFKPYDKYQHAANAKYDGKARKHCLVPSKFEGDKDEFDQWVTRIADLLMEDDDTYKTERSRMAVV